MDQHLQGLRGLAIALVVAFHLEIPPFSGGALGVDVFFVISGFVITRSLLAEQDRTGRVHLADFFARRMRRLVPVSTVVLAATLAALWLFWDIASRQALASQAFAAPLASMNLWSALKAVDYGGPVATSSPFSHLWSLALEEQFYLVLAPAFVLFGRLRQSKSSSRRLMVGSVVAAGLVSFAVSVAYGRGSQPAFAFYLLEARAWELLSGVLLALLPGLVSAGPRAWRSLSGWAGLALVAAASVTNEILDGRPTVGPALAVAGAALVILAGPGTGRFSAGRALSLRPFTALGAIAYPLYLWHWPLYVSLLERGASIPMFRPVVIGASIALATLTHVIVEQRVRWWQFLVRRPWTTIAGGVAVSVVVAVASVPLTPSPSPVDRPHIPGQVATFLPSDLRPSLQSVLRLDLPADPPCTFVALTGDERECVFGAASSTVTIVLVGDSHAGQWLPALDAAGREHGWRVVAKWYGGCAWMAVAGDQSEEDPGLCDTVRAEARQFVAAVSPDLVVAGTYFQSHASEATALQVTNAIAAATSEFPADTKLLILGDVPVAGGTWPRCLLENPDEVARCDMDRSDSVDRRTERAVSAGARLGAARFQSTAEWVCPQERCPLIRENLLVFRDADHLAPFFARTLAPQLATAVDRAISSPGAG